MLTNKLNTLTLIFIFNFCSLSVINAQVEKGTEIIRLGGEISTRKKGFFSNSMIKLNPLSPLVGIGQIEFEKELGDVFLN